MLWGRRAPLQLVAPQPGHEVVRQGGLVRCLVEAEGKHGDFLEVFVDTPLEVCEARDPKGLYKQARDGKIANFTGISDPYEAPTDPEIHLRTDQLTVEAAAKQVVNSMAERGLFST